MATETTPIWGMPYPALDETADVPRDLEALTVWLDSRFGSFNQGALGSRGSGSPANKLYLATNDYTAGPNGTLYLSTGSGWVVVGGGAGAELPWLVDLNPIGDLANNGWQTYIKERAGGSSSGAIDGNGDWSPATAEITHGIGEAPTGVQASIDGSPVPLAPGISADATKVYLTPSFNGRTNGTTQKAYWEATNEAGPARKSAGAIDADVTFPVALSKGTWALELLHNKGPDRGKYTVSIDGVDLGTIIDGYAASLTPKQRSQITGITVAKSKVQNVRLRMASKNPSATAYVGHISGLRLRRTA